ncbi:MAG: hypothetical protein LW688_06775 [Cryomorphaceae bacterium]|jgi:hypothetical protein|nr:hypothetical protein [Cryomorphaceae bacterium]
MKGLLCFLVSLFLLSGCVKNNPDPVWLKITPWTLVGNPDLVNVEGELSQNFSDAWVYVNDKIIGVFELPVKIPVLESGTCNIKIYPAVRNNGISSTKKMYPFVKRYELTAELIPNSTFTIDPVTMYDSNTQFWIEDFEDAAVKINTDQYSADTMLVGTDPAIMKWNRYGISTLNAIDSTWIAYTSEGLALPKGQEVYLELDYYNTNSMVTGVLAIVGGVPQNNIHVRLNAQKLSEVRWKKMYIDLREIVSNSAGANTFLISLQAALDEENSEGIIILDNIKVVHF